MWGIRRLSLMVIGLLLLGVLCAPVAHADTNDFTIRQFAADYTLDNTDRQGRLRIVERIEVDFTDDNHGLLRAIPQRYKNHQLQLQVHKISSRSGAPAQYSTYTSNGNMVLKIGDPDRTVTGQQQYTIDYSLNNVIGFYNDHDELYWDINGDQWAQQANEVSVTLHLPRDLKLLGRQPLCFAGSRGSTAQTCTIQTHTDKHEITAVTSVPLHPYQTLTIVAGFEKGYFAPATTLETIGEYIWMIAAFIVPLLILGGTTGILWFRRGRDARGRGVIVPQYDAPDNLSPIEVGTIVDFNTENRDITATIIDLAIRRYITIIEHTKDRKFFKDITTYTLRLERTDTSGLTAYESKIVRALFSDFTAAREIDMSVLKFKLNATAQTLRSQVRGDLGKAGYFREHLAVSTSLKIIGLVVVGLVVCGLVAGLLGVIGPFVGGCIVGAIVAGVFLALMPSRTVKGVAANEHSKGLQLYLKTAEADRLKLLQGPNARYASGKEPVRTVALFEKLLPYAMVLGVEQQWAKQFEGLYQTPPDWYSGHTGAFSAAYLATSLNSGVGAAANAVFSSSSDSSGSGFSGGSAGGGGGGGGGGGW